MSSSHPCAYRFARSRICRQRSRMECPDRAGLSTPRHIAEFIREARVRVLMVAGNRESKQPGIGEGVERFLLVVFRALATSPRPTAQSVSARHRIV
ncbi:MAG: putative molybdenum carrier protein, partial [Isosphaeraceae bacterium]